ncbi:AAA family ATPase [Mycobacterium szulgai]|uniref:AAA family ATPase n=1 Tax=Mycobacterium szulgai TaxID=1787 RepID=UPI000A1EAD51|nr:AAA family ATPase [Mycobacterium szulgai]
MASKRTLAARIESTLVGRDGEIECLTAILNDTINRQGSVVGITAPPGIGKSRICRELVKVAQARGVAVFSTFCESHAKAIAFTAIGPVGARSIAAERTRSPRCLRGAASPTRRGRSRGPAVT